MREQKNTPAPSPDDFRGAPRFPSVTVALALVGAFVGAGFASGRELIDFFLRFGRAGLLGMALAALLIGGLSAHLLWVCRQSATLSVLCSTSFPRTQAAVSGLFALFLWVTAAAMSGGMRALLDALWGQAYPPRWLLAACTLLMVVCCAALARGKLTVLTALGGLLVPVLCAVTVCLRLSGATPLDAGAALSSPPAPDLEWLGLSVRYSAFNIALSIGIFPALGSALPTRASALRAGAWTALLLTGLFALSASALLPHVGTLQYRALPLLALAEAHSPALRLITCALLAVAMTSSLLAALRGVSDYLSAQGFARTSWLLSALLAFALSLLGFATIVRTLYPLLGTVAMALIVALCARQRGVREQRK